MFGLPAHAPAFVDDGACDDFVVLRDPLAPVLHK